MRRLVGTFQTDHGHCATVIASAPDASYPTILPMACASRPCRGSFSRIRNIRRSPPTQCFSDRTLIASRRSSVASSMGARRRPPRSSIWAAAAVSATSSRPDGRVDGRFWRWRMLIPPPCGSPESTPPLPRSMRLLAADLLTSRSPGDVRSYRRQPQLPRRPGAAAISRLLTWPYSGGWGYYPSGGAGLLLVIVIVLWWRDGFKCHWRNCWLTPLPHQKVGTVDRDEVTPIGWLQPNVRLAQFFRASGQKRRATGHHCVGRLRRIRSVG